VFSLVGVVLAVVLSRTVRRPRTVFVRTTVVLTALSLVPDVIVDAAPTTKALLMMTHLVAAAIVIPMVARRLAA
jgi:peptidoglycan/LPS O-acetylase OafA/YrhL